MSSADTKPEYGSNVIQLRLTRTDPYCAPRTGDAYEMDLEFSDYGRDRRFRGGWWLLPLLLASLTLCIFAAMRLF